MIPYQINRKEKLDAKIKKHFPEVDIYNLSKCERDKLAYEIRNKVRNEKKQRQREYLAF